MKVKPVTKTVIAIIAVLAAVYLALIPLAANGYGYAGYDDKHYRPSRWHFHRSTFYENPSVRDGSVDGPRRVGGGPGSGK